MGSQQVKEEDWGDLPEEGLLIWRVSVYAASLMLYTVLMNCCSDVCICRDCVVCDSGQQTAVDQMALDDDDSDDEKRGSFEDSSDEDLDSAPTIRQQPEPVMSQQQQQVESMDISSSDGVLNNNKCPI